MPKSAFEGHQSQVKSLAVSSDQLWLASAAISEQNILLWDLNAASPKPRALYNGKNRVLTLGFRPGSNLLAWAGSTKTIHLTDLLSSGSNHALEGHKEAVTALRFTADAQYLFSSGLNGKICRWPMNKLKEPDLIFHQPAPVRALAYDNKNHILASGGEDGIVRLWHINDLTPGNSGVPEYVELESGTDRIYSLAISAQGRYLAAGGSNRRIAVLLGTYTLAEKLCAIAGRNPNKTEWKQLIEMQKPEPLENACLCFDGPECSDR